MPNLEPSARPGLAGIEGWAIVMACALAALEGTFGLLPAEVHADSLVPVLVSTQKWTPFYWDQSRLGMLVPLLAMPFHRPAWNMGAQIFLNSFAQLSVFALAAWYLFRGPGWSIAGGLAAVLFLSTPRAISDDSFGQPYGVSLALGFLSLRVVKPADEVVCAIDQASLDRAAAFAVRFVHLAPGSFNFIDPIWVYQPGVIRKAGLSTVESSP